MGSMTRVMQKVLEDHENAKGAGDAAAPETSPESGAAEPQDQAAAASQVEPSGATDTSEGVAEVEPEPPPPLEGGPEPDGQQPPTRFVTGEPQSGAPSTIERPQSAEWAPGRVDPVVVAFHDRYSAVCEQYRAVRARLLTMSPGYGRQVIAITSSIPEEGKSVTAVNLSLVMAEGGEHQILMVDADFRRSALARMLGVSNKPGLVDLLRGEAGLDAVIQPTPFPNLKLIPAGEARGSAYSEMLGGPSMAAVLEEFRGRFDYTFIDTPPITTVSDVSLLAPHCNGALVIIEMHRTPEPTVQQAVRTLQANNVKILGCVLSRFRDRGIRYYDRYYSYYYGQT